MYMSNVLDHLFCHPGTLLGPNEIASFKNRKVPDSKAVAHMTSKASLDYVPKAMEKLSPGAYGAGTGTFEITGDGAMAYQHAICYLLHGKTEHAKKSLEIILAWAKLNKIFDGSNAPLVASWAISPMIQAAEILKYQCPTEWQSSKAAPLFVAWVQRIIYPLICTKISWTNNWNITMTEARMQWAIFQNASKEFQWCVAEYKRLFAIYVSPWKTGQCLETKRDQVHAQFGIGSMINICEMAWHQGVDLYSHELHKCMEYHASIVLGEVPTDLNKTEIKENRFQPTGWEIGFQHFTKVKKMPMPKTHALLEKNRPEWCVFCWGLCTVTHMR